MIILSEKEVDFIHDDLLRNGIVMDELRCSLVDHICCVIEEEMSEEDNFEEFYAKILPRFYERKLKEIQDETHLVLTFKHYYAMKKIMIQSGAFTAICFTTGSIFKLMHWPGAAFLLLASILVFSFLFLPILFLFKTREVNLRSQKTIIGVATIFGVLFSMSTLFKLMHWPYANVLWLSSLGLLLLVFLPLFFFTGIRNAETKLNTIITSILILVAGSMFFALTALYNTKWVDGAQALSTARSYEVATLSENMVKTKCNPSTHKEFHKRSNELCAAVDELKEDLRKGLPRKNRKLSEKRLSLVYANDLNIVDRVLFLPSGEPNKKLSALKKGLNELNAYLVQHAPDSGIHFHTENAHRFDEKDQPIESWESLYFYHTSIGDVFQQLNMLKVEIRLAEMSL